MKRASDAFEFKKRWPRVYRRIIETYGKDKIHDMQAAIVLWINKQSHPQCEICGTKLTITKKFRDTLPSKLRCSKHTNTNSIVSIDHVMQQCPPHIHITQSSIPEFLTRTDILEFNCTHHGSYKQSVGYFLKGGGCQQCYITAKSGVPLKSKEEWINQCNKVHNNFYSYANSMYTTTLADVVITCPIHGDFVQNAGVHSRGHGCRKCANETASVMHTLTTAEFINRAVDKHGDKYDYSLTEYKSTRTPVKIICKKHGVFNQIPYYHTAGNGCPTCGVSMTTYKSAAEYEIVEWLKSCNISNIEHSDRSLGFELDIYLPDHKLAIEYNGIYWHSSASKETDSNMSKQHLFKTETCEKNGITLLHILDIEWTDPVKQEIWKSTILHKLGMSRERIWARKCGIVLVGHKSAMNFFAVNHLQGPASSAINIGLQYNGKLVAVGSFAKSRFNKKDKTAFELIRFASLCNTSVVGGFQKIIKEFSRTHRGVLISYANRRWSQGAVYKASNFELESISGPCYYYTNCKTLWHRSVFQKHKLNNLLQSFDPTLSEVDNMYNNKYRRIWDCGHLVFKINL